MLHSANQSSNQTTWLRPLLLITIVAIAAMSRLIPHPPNFTPLAAIALFGGAYFGNRAMAFVVPLIAMLISDMVIGFYPAMGFIYVSLALIVCLGMFLQRRKSGASIACSAIASSVLFFVVSNFGYWMMMGTYTRDLSGLMTCYVMAIPFFWNTLAGDLIFVSLMFGSFEVATRCVPQLRQPVAA